MHCSDVELYGICDETNNSEDTIRRGHSTWDIIICLAEVVELKSELLFQPHRDSAGVCTVCTVPTVL